VLVLQPPVLKISQCLRSSSVVFSSKGKKQKNKKQKLKKKIPSASAILFQLVLQHPVLLSHQRKRGEKKGSLETTL
jgi:hypothetical protein